MCLCDDQGEQVQFDCRQLYKICRFSLCLLQIRFHRPNRNQQLVSDVQYRYT